MKLISAFEFVRSYPEHIILVIKRGFTHTPLFISTETRSTLSFGIYETEATPQFAETLIQEWC